MPNKDGEETFIAAVEMNETRDLEGFFRGKITLLKDASDIKPEVIADLKLKRFDDLERVIGFLMATNMGISPEDVMKEEYEMLLPFDTKPN